MFKPIPLNLPPYALKLKRIDEKVYIFDELRKKNLLLTPEEWVRQHWVQYLSLHKKYPKALMRIEGGMTLQGLQKRTDLVIYNKEGEKILLAEFKAPGVKISQKTFEQISNYNSRHKAPLLLVSNGLEHYYCRINYENESFDFLDDLPNYIQST